MFLTSFTNEGDRAEALLAQSRNSSCCLNSNAIFLVRLPPNDARNGPILRCEIHRITPTASKLLMELVPRAGVEPARPFGQRILSPAIEPLPSRTKRYKPVFTRLAVLKVSLRLALYQHVPPPS